MLNNKNRGEDTASEPLIDIVARLSSEKNTISVPASIFSSILSPAEVLVKYLKENENLKFVEIAKLLNRDQRGIWCTYQRAIRKFSRSLAIPHCSHIIPLSVLSNRQLSVLEALVHYLRQNNVRVVEIAKLVNKSPSTIGAVHHRVRGKLR